MTPAFLSAVVRCDLTDDMSMGLAELLQPCHLKCGIMPFNIISHILQGMSSSVAFSLF